MASLFTIDPTCADIKLDAYLNDALTMLASAQTGISNLQGTTFFTQSTTRHYMRNAANTYGTKYYPKTSATGLSTADGTTVAAVSSIMQHTLRQKTKTY